MQSQQMPSIGFTKSPVQAALALALVGIREKLKSPIETLHISSPRKRSRLVMAMPIKEIRCAVLLLSLQRKRYSSQKRALVLDSGGDVLTALISLNSPLL